MFAYALVQNVRERPDGIIIGSIFIVTLIAVSIISRYLRQGELRVRRLNFCDAASARLWDELITKRVNVVPVNEPSPAQLRGRARPSGSWQPTRPRGRWRFVHVGLLDNRSEFYEEPVIKVVRVGDDYRIEVSEATVVANTIAYLCHRGKGARGIPAPDPPFADHPGVPLFPARHRRDGAAGARNPAQSSEAQAPENGAAEAAFNQ